MGFKHSEGKRRRSTRSRNNFELLPEELIAEILSKLPPFNLLLVESVCRSWRQIVKSSAQFQILWKQRSVEQVQSDFKFNNWCLTAQCEFFFVYAHKKKGKLRFLDASDLQSVELRDKMIGRKRLSFYVKKGLASVKVIPISERFRVKISIPWRYVS
ncbi:hypothetical protein SUGI_0351390 [Cryptomeria japonica]|nr:hypothetical protein SUGI_0351390 [Cryptomeria japonica]